MVKIGKYDLIQSGNISLSENLPLSLLCDDVLIDIMYKEANESSLLINGECKANIQIQAIAGRSVYAISPYLILKKGEKEYFISFILSAALQGRRNLIFNLLRN